NILINYTFDELYATIIIKDEGIGISEEQMQKLFKINEDVTLDVSRKSKTKGTGLGLILAKQLLDLNKGNIYIDSEIGKGTEVKIKMPLFQKFN
ncbi:MAG: ATP-binding protein, partial [Ignavibacteriae bacterium]|nr:ATP-binding protein [Ignavibacteriota bacterium]